MAPPLSPVPARPPWRPYAAVALTAVVCYVGALWNGFAVDDVPIIVLNPLVGHASGIWRAFAAPYWPPELGGALYRPLVIATLALDRLIDGTAWFHAVNLLWHAAVSVAVAVLVRRLSDGPGALVSGVIFAVHPVHVEAVANVVGRAELMAALFAVLAVYAALAKERVAWSTAAWSLGLLCKENAAVVPALIVWAWILGFGRPDRRRVVLFVTSWVLIGAVYTAVRAIVRHPFAGYQNIAPMFVGEPALAVRLTAVAALADVTRLLVFPLTLRVDYSPLERTVVSSVTDPRVIVGVLCGLLWAALLIRAWQRGRRVEALGLGWIGVAFLPVANLVFTVGFYVAERTLYLPSIGLVVALAAWLARLPVTRLRAIVAMLVVLGGVRTALRVPVWRSDATVTRSVLRDSPRSYVGPKRMTAFFLDRHDPPRALASARLAAELYDRDPTIFVTGSVAAFAAGNSGAADTMLAGLERLCHTLCGGYYQHEAMVARTNGYGAAADSLLARAQRLAHP